MRTRNLSSGITTGITYLVAIVMFFPILWIALMGFKTEVQAYHLPPLWIFRPTFSNWLAAFQSGYVRYLWNSIRIAGTSVIVALALGLPVAYHLARVRIHGQGQGLWTWFLSTKFMPAVGIIVPVFLVYDRLHLLDTALGLGMIYVALALPVVILIMTSFMDDIPAALFEAAAVDGANDVRILGSIVVPIMIPGIVTAGILAFIFNWNEFFFAVNLTNVNAATVPVFMAQSLTSEGLFWSHIAAVATLGMLPVVLLGWLAQKRIVRGLSFGAVK